MKQMTFSDHMDQECSIGSEMRQELLRRIRQQGAETTVVAITACYYDRARTIGDYHVEALREGTESCMVSLACCDEGQTLHALKTLIGKRLQDGRSLESVAIDDIRAHSDEVLVCLRTLCEGVGASGGRVVLGMDASQAFIADYLAEYVGVRLIDMTGEAGCAPVGGREGQVRLAAIPPMITMGTCAKIAQVSKSTINSLVRDGAIPGVLRMRGTVRLRTHEVLEFFGITPEQAFDLS